MKILWMSLTPSGYTALVLKNDSQNREADFSPHPYGYEQTDTSEKPTELQNITIKPMWI